MQTTLQLANNQQLINAWAFAAEKNRVRGIKRQRITHVSNCVITACSSEAKSLGIRVGMKYAEAKLRVPQLKILVIGGRSYARS